MDRVPPMVRILFAVLIIIATLALPNILPSSSNHSIVRSSLKLLFSFVRQNDASQTFNKLPYLRVFDGYPAPDEEMLREIDRITNEAAFKYQLDPNLIRAVIFVESTFRTKIRSRVGAKGLMQITDPTADYLGIQNSLDPEDNIQGGAKYLRKLLNQFRGDIRLALAAYNAGPTNVRRYKGVPPFPETQQYIKKILKAYGRLQGARTSDPYLLNKSNSDGAAQGTNKL
jgi:hypothetical protein